MLGSFDPSRLMGLMYSAVLPLPSPSGASLAYAPVQARGGASPVGALAGAIRRDSDGADYLTGCNHGADR